VTCGLTGDATDRIVVHGLHKVTTTYTVGLDAAGHCTLRRDGDDWAPWQVLKAALEPLLFG